VAYDSSAVPYVGSGAIGKSESLAHAYHPFEFLRHLIGLIVICVLKLRTLSIAQMAHLPLLFEGK
jgi:hypothetical protein